MNLRRLLLMLTALALLLGLCPAAGAENAPAAPDYVCADAIFDQIYGRLLGRRAPMDDTLRADSVQRLLADAEGVVPGSVRRTGDELTWMTEGGVACRFSPYLYSLAVGAAAAADPSDPPRRQVPEGAAVCLFAPYYGLDDAFEGVGGTYDTWGETLAFYIGGGYSRYERTEATVDRIAEAVERCAVVLIDSHGEMDRDQTTSYICLQTGEGITSADYAVDPALGISHAYYGGRGSGGVSFYEVDGTAIANHMDSVAAGGLFWSGTCFGMATDGLCAPLLRKGVSAVYGYSRDVSFGGDRCWMGTFMDVITDGGTLAQATAEMKRVWGAWDFSAAICAQNSWSSHLINDSADEARQHRDAFPVLASAEDPYPANPDGLQTVRSAWRLPDRELTIRPILPDGVKCPEIRSRVYGTGRLPAPEGKPRSQEYSFSFVGWSLTSFPPCPAVPAALFHPGDSFRFGCKHLSPPSLGHRSQDPLDFGAESVDLYGVYSFSLDGQLLYTTQVPDGEEDPDDPSRRFTDVAFGTWYYQAVRESVAGGLIRGYDDGSFRPAAPIRRSEVVTILHRAAGSPEAATPAGFADVPSGCFYEKALDWAAENRIVLGYSDGLFHPDEPVTRAQLAALIRRFARAEEGDPAVLDRFPDRADVPRWAQADLAWAVQTGLIQGSRSGGTDYLLPTGRATRAQFVTIIQRYLTTPAKEETP